MRRAFLCRFYGWTADYVENMPAIQAWEYSQAATKLSAGEMIRDIKCNDFSNWKQHDRKHLMQKLEREAQLEREGMSFDDFFSHHGVD